MFKSLTNWVFTPSKKPIRKAAKPKSVQLAVERLEQRDLMATLIPINYNAILSITPSITLVGSTIKIQGSSGNDHAVIFPPDEGIPSFHVSVQYKNFLNSEPQIMSLSVREPVTDITFVGGSGNDTVINLTSIPMNASGGSGIDRLVGGSRHDTLDGGTEGDTLEGGGGNDTLIGGNGSDKLYGGFLGQPIDSSATAPSLILPDWWVNLYPGSIDVVDLNRRLNDGDDTLLGGSNDDRLEGGTGDDHLNGGSGYDRLYGGGGDDVLISLDGQAIDYVDGGVGRDTIWADPRSGLPFIDETIVSDSSDKVHRVSGFANTADRTLDGDRITDPTIKAGQSYKTFAGNPLFSTTGPSMMDGRQGALNDSWLIAGLGAIVNRIKQNVVDFDDGTYGVHLGDKFYRVDNDLAVASSTSTAPVYAQVGAENSMWVAVVEKAYAHYRTGANSYASLEGGWAGDVNTAFGLTATIQSLQSFGSSAAMANELLRLSFICNVTIGSITSAAGTPLENGLDYIFHSVTRNASGVVTSITLRNPRGVDGINTDVNPFDGLVTVTPDQLFQSMGSLTRPA